MLTTVPSSLSLLLSIKYCRRRRVQLNTMQGAIIRLHRVEIWNVEQADEWRQTWNFCVGLRHTDFNINWKHSCFDLHTNTGKLNGLICFVMRALGLLLSVCWALGAKSAIRDCLVTTWVSEREYKKFNRVCSASVHDGHYQQLDFPLARLYESFQLSNLRSGLYQLHHLSLAESQVFETTTHIVDGDASDAVQQVNTL